MNATRNRLYSKKMSGLIVQGRKKIEGHLDETITSMGQSVPDSLGQKKGPQELKRELMLIQDNLTILHNIQALTERNINQTDTLEAK